MLKIAPRWLPGAVIAGIIEIATNREIDIPGAVELNASQSVLNLILSTLKH
jgi:hypothetical protein